MLAMTMISEAAAAGRSEAGRAATPAEARAAPAEHRPADPAPAEAKAQPAVPNKPGTGTPSRSLRRLIIPLTAVGAAAALVLLTSARWDAWMGAAAVQTTDNATVGRVLAGNWRALAGSGVLFAGLLILSSVLMYFAEGRAQPEALGDVPKAMWWAVVTLSTVGYGDVLPVTVVGKMIAGLTMVMGIMFFALPVGIIATGFLQEIQRRDFVVSFGMVARVPLFASLDAPMIAQLVGLLNAKRVSAGAIVVRKGDEADGMYFIASGEVEVDVPAGPVRLGEGDFFGEIALIEPGARRTATVTAVRPSELLVLDVEGFHRLMGRNPLLAEAVKDVASQRLRSLGKPAEQS